MEKSKKKKTPINVLSTTAIAATVLATTIGTPYASAAENNTDDKNPKTTDSKEASMPINVDNSKIKQAVEEAKAAGLKVNQDQTKSQTVPIADTDKAKQQIQADYDQQIQAIKAQVKKSQNQQNKYKSQLEDFNAKNDQYKQDKAKYDANMKSYETAKAQYDQDIKDYKDAVAKYNADMKTYENKLAQYKKDLADYQEKASQNKEDKQKYQEELEQYKKDKAAYDKAVENSKTSDANYKKELEEYNQKVEQIKKENQALKDAYTKKVDAEKSVVDKAASNPKQPSYSEGEGGAYTKSGSWTNLAAKTLNGGDIHVASKGDVNSLADLQNGNFAIHAYSDSNKLKNSNIIQKITWGNVQPKGASSLTKGDMITKDAQDKLKSIGYKDDIYNTSGEANQFAKTTQLWSVKAGEWVTIPKAIHLADGTTKDLKVKFKKSGTKLDYGEDWVTFWNEGNSINYYDGSMDRTHTPPKETISATYQVDDGGANEDYLWTGVTLDIDSGQQLTMNGDNYAILGMGGGLKANGNTIKSIKADDGLGITWGKNKTEDNFLDGTSSIPDGTIVYARYGNQISHSLANTGVKNATLVANGDFGLGVKTSVAEYPKLKKLPKKPTPPNNDVPKEPTPPEAPGNVGEPPKEPTKPTPPGNEPKEPTKPTPPTEPGNPPKEPEPLAVSYHLNTLNVTPTNHKDVEKGVQKDDTENSIDKQQVNVGDVLTYPLTNSDLPADRKDDIKSYVIKDTVPEGVEPNKEELDKTVDKDKWDVKVDGQTVTFTATKDLLEDMNKDKKKAFKVPTAPLVVTVTKGGDANLDNTFDTIINDATVKSNVVTNTPPELVKKAAKKTVSTDKIVDFNEGYQYGLDFTIPNDKNYKSLEIKDSDMTKGSLDFDKVVVKQDGKDITDQGKLDFDKEKDTFTWKANNPTSLLGKTVHVDIDAKVKPGTDLSKYKTDEKDENGNVIYSMPNTGHLVMDGEDTPTNEVPIRVKEIPGSIKKSIVEDDKLVESNNEEFGSDILYNLDVQFANNEKGNDVYVKDDLEKDVLDLQKDNIHVYTNEDIKNNASETDKDNSDKDDNNVEDVTTDGKDSSESDKDNAEDTNKESDAKSEESNTDEVTDDSKEDVKQQADTVVKDKTLKTGKYEVGKDIDAGKYTVTNNDPSDALVVTKDKNGETVTNETIKPDGSKDVELKDGEELSVTAGDKDVTFTSQATDSETDSNKSDNKDDSNATDSKETDKSDDVKDDSKADENEKSEETSKDSTESDGNAPNVKDMKDITEYGTLKVDEDNESFVWTPKDPSQFKGKKVVVQVGAKFKENENGNYKKYEKDGKYIVPNVAEMSSGDKDKAKKSNEVHSILDIPEEPKKEEPTPPKKEDPKDPEPEQPKEQPKQPENPEQPQQVQKQEQSQSQNNPSPQKAQPAVAQKIGLPSTGSNAADGAGYGIVIAAILGTVGYIFNKKRKNNSESDIEE